MARNAGKDEKFRWLGLGLCVRYPFEQDAFSLLKKKKKINFKNTDFYMTLDSPSLLSTCLFSFIFLTILVIT